VSKKREGGGNAEGNVERKERSDEEKMRRRGVREGEGR
jgi:hypothetical protein